MVRTDNKKDPEPDDFNLVPLLLTKSDIVTVLKKARRELRGEEVFQEARGFFWGYSDREDWEETVDLFERILQETDFEKESIVYSSWW